jgi:osmotically-inducible protein OsmY
MTVNPPQATEFRNDRDIQQAVLDELEWTPAVQLEHVGVSVRDGVVTLTGVAPSLTERTAAVKAALRVRGVTTVADDIRVALIDGDDRDAEIAEALGHALEDSVEIPHESIRATVRDGVVTLTGEVTWHYQRSAARRLAERVPGVREVDSRIELTRRPSAPDAQERIRNAIRRNAAVDASHVTVEMNGTEAVLRGTVRSFAERHQAEQAAWASPHVTAVTDLIDVSN